MARQEHDREDLLREAVALIERVELTAANGTAVVIGFRANGCASFYFSAELVYHFNASHELRRAHYDNRLYKAEQRQLISMSRERTAGEVQLIRHACTTGETESFLAEAVARLAEFDALLAGAKFILVGQVPADVDVIERVRRWLAALPKPIALAQSPHAR